MANRIVLCGASGFLGSAIIAEARKREIPILALSRKDHSKEQQDPLIQWLEVDINVDDSWQEKLISEDILIDAIGIIKEQGKGSFEQVNVELAKKLASIAKTKHLHGFVYISAVHFDYFFRKYLASKIKAESEVLNILPTTLIIRPNLMYGSKRLSSIWQKNGLLVLKKIPGIKFLLTKIQPVPVEQVAIAIFTQLSSNE